MRIFANNKIVKILSMILILSIAIFSVAQGSSDTISFCQGALGAVLAVVAVCTGVAAVIAVTSGTAGIGTVVLGATSVAATHYSKGLFINAIEGSWPYGGRSEGGGTDWNSSPLPLKDARIELVKEYSDTKQAIIKVGIIDNRDGSYVTLPDYDLYISHSNNLITLHEGDYRSASVSSSGISTTGTVGIKSVPNVTVAGLINKIEYTLDKEVQFVNMKVFNSSDQVVYDLSESCPNPAKPLPFVWKGIDMQGKKLPAGAYAVKVKAVKKDGTSEDAPLQIVTLSSAISQGTWKKVNLIGGKATYTLQSDYKEGTDTITVKMRDKSGNDVNEVVEQKVDVTFKNEDVPCVTQKTLPSKIQETIDGYLVALEFKDKGKETIITDGSTGNKYHFIEGGATFSIEQPNGLVKRPGIFDEDADPNEEEITESEYKQAAERVIYLLEAMAKQQGINFNGLDIPTVNKLSDGTTFAVSSDPSGNTIVLVTPPSESPIQLVAEYSEWTLSSPLNVAWESTLDLDNPTYATVGTGGGIRIASVSSGSSSAEVVRKVLILSLVREGKKEYMKTKEILDQPIPNVASVSWSIDTKFPLWLNCGFGPRKIITTGDFHMGLDFNANTYKTVRAMFDGLVKDVGWENLKKPEKGFGYRIRIESSYMGKKYFVYYGHLVANSEKIVQGNKVYAGQELAEADSTGYSTGHHLHLEVRQSDVENSRENPLKFLNYDSSNIKPTISDVVGPLFDNEISIPVGGSTTGLLKFKATIKTTEKDLDKVKMQLIKKPNQIIFDNTFDYHAMAKLEAAAETKTRYTLATNTFKWDAEGTMLMHPLNDLGTDCRIDEFICTWGDSNKDGEYKLLVEAIDVKGNAINNKGDPYEFKILNGKLQ